MKTSEFNSTQSEIANPAMIRKHVSNAEMAKLHRVASWKSILSIAMEWTLIIGCAYISELYFSWYLYPLVVIFIGARLLALGFIMHEAVHHLISKNSLLNDWLAEVFCAWPILVSMRSYRIKHLAHHAWLNTEDDPDFIGKSDANWTFPMKRMKFLKVLLVQISGLGIFGAMRAMSGAKVKTKKLKTPIWYHLLRVAFYAGIISLFVFSGNGSLLVLYWLIPFLTWLQMANRMRRIAEHSAMEDQPAALQTRTTIHGVLASIFLAPKNIAYHSEHHIYPGVPYYNLPQVHEMLTANESVKESVHVCDSYSEVYKECVQFD
ncbi:fatty acid desaturase family protein [Salibacteraceae bacterium]|nr:fatty acid desaturase family protein [Salibacteraceae bacterium]